MTDTVAPAVSAGDIETALAGHAQVREAAVLTRQTADGTRMVGYVVPEPATETAQAGWGGNEVLQSWRHVFDDTYETAYAPDSGGENSGWADSFTGRPIPLAEMAEWGDESARRVLALGPRRVLEIGAGTGLIMRRLLACARVERYVATDFSARSVELIGKLAADLTAEAPGTRTKVTVCHADAMQAPYAVAEKYDTVVINSVAQYFPSLYYLEEVLRRAADVVRPGGHILLGDLRNAQLAEAFVALKHERRTPPGPARATHHSATGDATREARGRELASDGELSVDPAWAASTPARLARVSHAEVAPRRGVHPNEMTLFRYDALLHIDCPPEPAAPEAQPKTAPESGHGLTLRALRAHLERDVGPIEYRGVANRRLREALMARDGKPTGTSTLDLGADTSATGLDPEEVWRLGEELARPTRVSWAANDSDGAFDVSFPAVDPAARSHFTLAGPGEPDGVDAAKVAVPYPPRTVKAAGDSLRSYLTQRLPGPVAPLDLVLVTGLPRSATGAPETAALPLPRRGVETASQEAAVTWGGDVLGLVLDAFAQQLTAAVCGPDDNFFAAGGESLKAAMCVRRLREQGLKVSIRDIYQCGTARALAERIGTTG